MEFYMEFLRVLKKTWVAALIIFTAIIGVCLFKIHNSSDSQVYKFYKQMIGEYKEQLAVSSKESAQKAVFGKKKEDDENTEYRQSAMQLLTEKINYTDNYKNTLQITSDYEKILNSSLYSGQNDFGRINALKYAEDMSALSDVNVTLGNTTAIEKLMEFREIPVLFAVMMIIFIIAFVEERDNGVIMIVRSSGRGRSVLALKRNMIIIAFSIVYSFIFNMAVYGIYLYVYGGSDDLGNAVQSSEMFSMFPMKISVGQFFCLYCLVFALAMSVLGMLFYLFISFFKNYKIAIVLLLAIFLCGFILYENIEANSALCIFKYVNLINILLPGTSYVIYENWGYNGFITDISTSTYIITSVTGALSFAGVVLAGCFLYPDRRESVLDRIYDKIILLWQKIFYRTNSLFMELYKTFVIQKGLLILVIAVYLFANCKLYRGVDYSQSSFYLVDFYEEFSGKAPDEACEEYLNNFKAELDNLKKIENPTYIQRKNAEDMSSALSAMNTVVEHVNKMRDEKGINAVIVKPDTYNDILGERNYANQENINLVCIIAVILILSGDFSFERNSGMYVLGRTAKRRELTWRNKTQKLLLTAAAMWGISFLINWLNVTSLYDFNDLSAPVQSLSEFADFPLRVSIAGYIVLCQLVRLFLLCMISFIVSGISFYMDYKRSVALSVVLLLPHVLYIFDIPFMYYLSAVISLDFNRYWLRFGNSAAGFILPAVIIAAGAALYMRAYWKWRGVKSKILKNVR